LYPHRDRLHGDEDAEDAADDMGPPPLDDDADSRS
jgi:hypothetical protein